MRRRGSLGLGLALCICGAAVAVAPDAATLAAWAARFWPVLLVVAGVGAIAGFALRRVPRSPYSGALLLAVGGLALGATLKTATGPLSLYGRFWPLLLGVIALVEVLKHYTHRPEMGERPALFGSGKLALVGLIVVTGMVSNRLAVADPNLLARVSLPPALEKMRDDLLGDEFAFDPTTQSAALPDGGLVTVTNRFGDVKIEGTDGDRVVVEVTPRVRAYDRESARRVADRLRLTLEPNGTTVAVGTNRDEIDHEIATDLKVRVPKGASLRIAQSHGAVALSNVAANNGTIDVNASFATVEMRDVAGAIAIRDEHDSVLIERGSGSVAVKGSAEVAVRNFAGPIRLEGSDAVELTDVTAPTVDLAKVDHADVLLERVAGPVLAAGSPAVPVKVTIQGSHTGVTLRTIGGDVAVKTMHESISATDVAGALEVDAGHADVNATRVGSLKVRTNHAEVVANSISGAVDVTNDHGSVVVSDFRSACSVRTSFDAVRLVAAAGSGDISVDNEHGKIDIQLPVGPRYSFEQPQATRGEVRIDPSLSGAASGGEARRVALKTTFEDIVVRPLSGREDSEDPA